MKTTSQRVFVALMLILSVATVGGFLPDTTDKPATSPAPKTPEQELAELKQDCFNTYRRMCRDETEAFWAGFRSGFNKSLRD